MEGGYSSPSIIWIIPFDAIMLALSRGTAFSPNRIFPWGKKKDGPSISREWVEVLNQGTERLTLSEMVMETS